MFNTVVDFVEIRAVFKRADAMIQTTEATREGLNFLVRLFNKCTMDQRQILESECPSIIKQVV